MNPGCPLVAMGTSRTDPDLLQNAIKFGIECGFRVIDTAAVYGNQEPLKKAISAVLEGRVRTTFKSEFKLEKTVARKLRR